MPFCSQCGNAVDPADRFCGKCGAGQPAASGASPGFGPHPGYGPGRPVSDRFGGISPKTASILCYVPGAGWIAAVVVLASERFRHNRDIRFHAFQGLYLFVAWLMNQWVVRELPWPVPHFGLYGLIQVALVIMAVFMMVKASHEQVYSLPLFGELAARSVAEN